MAKTMTVHRDSPLSPKVTLLNPRNERGEKHPDNKELKRDSPQSRGSQEHLSDILSDLDLRNRLEQEEIEREKEEEEQKRPIENPHK